jgi:hypothetical protein
MLPADALSIAAALTEDGLELHLRTRANQLISINCVERTPVKSTLASYLKHGYNG